MKDILIFGLNESKSVAQKLFDVLSKAGYDCTLDKSELSDNSDLPALAVAIFSKNLDKDALFVKFSDICDLKGIPLIPFVTVAFEKTASAEYFFNSHYWIDSVENNLNDACLDLTDFLDKNFKTLKANGDEKRDARKAIKPVSKKVSAKLSKKNNVSHPDIWRAAALILSVVCLILLIVVVNQSGGSSGNASVAAGDYSNSAPVFLSKNLTSSENSLVGLWILSDYQDNQFKPGRQDSLTQQQLVNSLIGKASLNFNSDKSFVRSGFQPEPEKGTWEYDPSNKYLKLKPEGVNSVDAVQIQDINDKIVTIVVSEKMPSGAEIITKLTFTKKS